MRFFTRKMHVALEMALEMALEIALDILEFEEVRSVPK